MKGGRRRSLEADEQGGGATALITSLGSSFPRATSSFASSLTNTPHSYPLGRALDQHRLAEQLLQKHVTGQELYLQAEAAQVNASNAPRRDRQRRLGEDPAVEDR